MAVRAELYAWEHIKDIPSLWHQTEQFETERLDYSGAWEAPPVWALIFFSKTSWNQIHIKMFWNNEQVHSMKAYLDNRMSSKHGSTGQRCWTVKALKNQ